MDRREFVATLTIVAAGAGYKIDPATFRLCESPPSVAKRYLVTALEDAGREVTLTSQEWPFHVLHVRLTDSKYFGVELGDAVLLDVELGDAPPSWERVPRVQNPRGILSDTQLTPYEPIEGEEASE